MLEEVLSLRGGRGFRGGYQSPGEEAWVVALAPSDALIINDSLRTETQCGHFT